MYIKLQLLQTTNIWHAGPRRCDWQPPVEVTQFWYPKQERFWRPFPFLKDQTKINPSVWNCNLNHFKQLLFHTFPPPLDQYNLLWPYKKREPKPLLGCQNWVTLMGGCQKLVPGWQWHRRGPACHILVVCHSCSLIWQTRKKQPNTK